MAADESLLSELVQSDLEFRLNARESVPVAEYLERFPQFREQLLTLWQSLGSGDTAPALRGSAPGGYEILREVGRGAMGVVYQARQTALKRFVALKMILAKEYAGPDQLARFRAEAEAVACLQHPNIVQVFDSGAHEGRPYLAMEFVDGGTLAARIQGTPQLPREAAQLIATLARPWTSPIKSRSCIAI